MKNKFLAIFAAAGIAAVGSTLFSAPAHAQLGPIDQDVNVEIDVPEVLYLRTFETISLGITEDELAGGAAVTTAGLGQDFDATGTTDGTTLIDQTSPFAGLTGGVITKTVDELYAVWSNSPRAGGVTIALTVSGNTLTAAGGATATITSAVPTVPSAAAPGLDVPVVGGADLEFDLGASTASGTYTGGVITVSVEAP
ncbi:MAG: hypothetical protein AB3A66_01325 [Nodularia sp. CChRGM 3473]